MSAPKVFCSLLVSLMVICLFSNWVFGQEENSVATFHSKVAKAQEELEKLKEKLGPGHPDSVKASKVLEKIQKEFKDYWTPLFDGKSLNGWKGAEGLWSVEDGAITGRTTDDTKLKANSFLIWEKGPLSDFELTVMFRIEGGNSGVQFRSEDLKDFHVAGYQSDIDSNRRYTGILYEERLRGILCERGNKIEIGVDGSKKEIGKTCDLDEFAKNVSEDQWCEYIIKAKGNHITQSINGLLTVDLVDNDPKGAKSGILAFQIHAGPPMKVQFKEIYLHEIKK